MICPRCKQDMIVVEHHRVELDYCPKCEGVWFDTSELDLLLQTMDMTAPGMRLEDIVKSPAGQSSVKPPKCPICGINMKEVTIGQPGIEVDVCLRSDGLWFDGGEVHQLLKQLTEGSSATGAQPVLEFLGETLRGIE